MAEIIDFSVIESASNRYASLQDGFRTDLDHIDSTRSTAILSRVDEIPRYVNRLVQLGRTDLAAELLEKKSRGDEGDFSVLERVIAQNELMSVAFFPRGMKTAKAVCRIVIRDQNGRF